MKPSIEFIRTIEVGDRKLVLFQLDGQTACLASQVGRLLDLTHDSLGLSQQIRDEPSTYHDGETHRELRGATLKLLRKILGEVDLADALPGKTRSEIALLESGVHLVLAQTSSPMAIVLRRKLADYMPQLPHVSVRPAWSSLPRDEVDMMIQRLHQVAELSGILKEEDFDYVVRRILHPTEPHPTEPHLAEPLNHGGSHGAAAHLFAGKVDSA